MLFTINLIDPESTNFFIKNWYYFTALLLSFTGVLFGIKNYYKKNKKEKISPIQENSFVSNISPTINPVNNINVNVNTDNQEKKKEPENPANSSISRELKIDSLKHKVKILFIDDDKKFNVVKILKDGGWKNTYSVVDIKSVDIPIVKESDIYFVDINGVGKLLGCENEGLDIALMLKQKYPNKKIVIYSASKKTNSFHEAWDKCDFKLEKNALSYQFQSLVEKYSLELYS